MIDTRPAEYRITNKRTVAELTKEELELVVCDMIDFNESFGDEFLARLQHHMEQLDDDIFGKKETK